MTIGFETLRLIRNVEKQLASYGMKIGNPKYSRTGQVSVYPLDDELPCYTRDAEIFIGSVEEIEVWLKGIFAARMYDQLIGLSDDKKRAKKEQSVRNKQLLEMIETGEKCE